MQLGTLSEQRKNLISTTTAQPTITETPKKVETPVTVISKPSKPTQEVIVVQTPQKPTEQTSSKEKTTCTLCAINSYTNLAIKGTMVLVMLALFYNLIKTAK